MHDVVFISAFRKACENSDMAQLQLLFNERSQPDILALFKNNSPLPLCLWGTKKCVDTIGMLVKNGFDINGKDLNNRNVLYMNVINGSEDVVKRIVELGGSLDETTPEGMSIIDFVREDKQKWVSSSARFRLYSFVEVLYEECVLNRIVENDECLADTVSF